MRKIKIFEDSKNVEYYEKGVRSIKGAEEFKLIFKINIDLNSFDDINFVVDNAYENNFLFSVFKDFEANKITIEITGDKKNSFAFAGYEILGGDKMSPTESINKCPDRIFIQGDEDTQDAFNCRLTDKECNLENCPPPGVFPTGNKLSPVEIDVTACEFYIKKNGGHWCSRYDMPCKTKINGGMCDYNQLQRLTNITIMNDKEWTSIRNKLMQQLQQETKRADDKNDELNQAIEESTELRWQIKDIANLLDIDTGDEYSYGDIELVITELKEQNKLAEEELENYLNGDYCNSEKCNVVRKLETAREGLELTLTDLGCDYDFDPLLCKKCNDCGAANSCIYSKTKQLLKELE